MSEIVKEIFQIPDCMVLCFVIQLFILSYDIDYFLSVGFSACITPSSSALIPRISTLTVNFSSNLESERNKMHMFYPSGNSQCHKKV
jgi:hypothetical protein